MVDSVKRLQIAGNPTVGESEVKLKVARKCTEKFPIGRSFDVVGIIHTNSSIAFWASTKALVS
jgi:hypothetical protein